MKNRRILVSGAGIAGLTLSYWLQQHGFEPVVVEVAPAIKEGGYMIDFWGVGYTVAERMGIISQLEAEQAHYKIPEIEFVDEKNRKVGGLKVSKLRELTHHRYLNLLRSGLEKTIYQTVEKKVEIRFSTSITQVTQTSDGVEVTFNNGSHEAFDLLMGADGLRSNTRRLVFGPDREYERFLNYYTAAYTVENFLGKEHLFLSYTVPNQQVGIYEAGNHQLATFFIFSSEQYFGHLSQAEQKQKLTEVCGDLPWYVPEILQRMESAPDFYFDAVSQIELPGWYDDRVALVGDAAQAVSLISGQGSSLAMAGAYVLAGELKKYGGDHQPAFASYQHRMQPEIRRKQKSARNFAGSFVPSTKIGIFIRNQFTRLIDVPFISGYFVNTFICDKMRMEAY